MKNQTSEAGYINIIAVILLILMLIYNLIGGKLYNKVDKVTDELDEMNVFDIMEVVNDRTRNQIN